MSKWEIKKLEDCFSHIRNGASIKQGINNGGYPITRIETISEASINRDKMGYAGITDISKYRDYIMQSGDILMSHINSETHLGKTALYKRKDNEIIIHGMNLLCLRPINKIIFPDYIIYYFKSLAFKKQIPSITKKSVNQASFTISSLKKLYVPIPSIDEQHKIASILDTVSEALKLRKQQLNELDLLVKSRFVEMFGDPVENPMNWEVMKLKDLSAKITNGTTPKGGSNVYVDKGITFFRSQNVWKNQLVLDDIAYIDTKTHEKMRESSLKRGDILITKTGRINTQNSSLGRAALFMDEDNSANINGHVYLIRLKEEIDRLFVLNILISNSYRDHIRNVCVGGIDKRQLNKNHIEDFPIIIPPLDLQNKFATFVQHVDELKSEVQKSINETQTLFDSLMQRYFE